MQKAKLAKFYGWSLEYIGNLRTDDVATYYLASRRLEAQRMLQDIVVVTYPNLKEHAQKKLNKDLQKTAYPKSMEEKPLSTREVAEQLGKFFSNGRTE
jgi:hypothetical protein